jgi:hypothetical protein
MRIRYQKQWNDSAALLWTTVELCGRIAPLSVCLSSIPELGVWVVPTGPGAVHKDHNHAPAPATVTVTIVLEQEHSHRIRRSAHRLADQAPLVAWGNSAVLPPM